MSGIDLEGLTTVARMGRPVLHLIRFEAYSLAAGFGIGAVWMFLVAHFHPRWLGLSERTATRRRLEQIRANLVAELREVEGQMRTRPKRMRIDSKQNSEGQERAA